MGVTECSRNGYLQCFIWIILFRKSKEQKAHLNLSCHDVVVVMVTTLLRFKKSQVLIEVGNDTTKVKENIQNTNYKALFAMLSISIIDIERITKAYAW